MKDEAMTKAMQSVVDERIHQMSVWGNAHDDEHTPNEWVAILTAYLGKLAMSAISGNGVSVTRRLAVKVAATAVAMIEAIDRRFGDL